MIIFFFRTESECRSYLAHSRPIAKYGNKLLRFFFFELRAKTKFVLNETDYHPLL